MPTDYLDIEGNEEVAGLPSLSSTPGATNALPCGFYDVIGTVPFALMVAEDVSALTYSNKKGYLVPANQTATVRVRKDRKIGFVSDGTEGVIHIHKVSQ
ncbi:MAG: hypothetical protein ABTQ25_07930 [Nitrosomonas ureae]|uniref:hypothetical protein n=1 Tax=Nitrosomonas sp. TaxID=42353 RepID=UPI0025E91743|nr:hypothetical protein [Nitrosomonas sp.]